jgi:hypothetical protein
VTAVLVGRRYLLELIALIENPQVCSPKFLTCEQRPESGIIIIAMRRHVRIELRQAPQMRASSVRMALVLLVVWRCKSAVQEVGLDHPAVSQSRRTPSTDQEGPRPHLETTCSLTRLTRRGKELVSIIAELTHQARARPDPT